MMLRALPRLLCSPKARSMTPFFGHPVVPLLVRVRRPAFGPGMISRALRRASWWYDSLPLEDRPTMAEAKTIARRGCRGRLRLASVQSRP